MKYAILILSFIIPLFVFSQVDKMGYYKSEVMNSMKVQPCKQDSDNSIWFCDNNGNFQHYTFENEKVITVFYMWEFETKALADINVKKEIEATSKIYGRPTMRGEDPAWFVGDFLIIIRYGPSNGKHYSTRSVSKWRQ